MIISDKYRFVFIHIPKCAGTYVRNSIQKFDDTQGFFTSRVDSHESLGMLDYVHIPLAILEKYFPQEYNKVLLYQSFAVLRDPYERFFSSFAQCIRHTIKKNNPKNYQDISSVPKKALIKELEKTLAWLDSNFDTVLFPPEYVHFTPQIYYVKNGNQTVVKKLFTTDQIKILFSYISNLVQEEIKPPERKANVSKIYKNNFLKFLFTEVKNSIKLILPENTYLKAKSRFEQKYSALIFESDYKSFLESSEVKEFIEKHYADDYHLYRSICQCNTLS